MQYFSKPRYPFIDVDLITKLLVWSKGIIDPRYDPRFVRKDLCGNWMHFDEHGQQTDLGWEIDHVFPASRGGADDIDNLQPLWWRNNRRKGDNYPWWG